MTPDLYVASGGPEEPASWNRYAYVEGDPVNYWDPGGLCKAEAGTSVCFSTTVTSSTPGYHSSPLGTSVTSTSVTTTSVPPTPQAVFLPGVLTGDSPAGFNLMVDIGDTRYGGGGSTGTQEPSAQDDNTLPDAVYDCAALSFGLETVLGAGLSAAGQPLLATRGKLWGATAGTSIASQYLSKIFPKVLNSSVWAPTLANPLAQSAVVGRILGRWVPVVGYVLLAYDAVEFVDCVVEHTAGNAPDPRSSDSATPRERGTRGGGR